jgi:hypothetical protein
MIKTGGQADEKKPTAKQLFWPLDYARTDCLMRYRAIRFGSLACVASGPLVGCGADCFGGVDGFGA